MRDIALYTILVLAAVPAGASDASGRATQTVVSAVSASLSRNGVAVKGRPNTIYAVSIQRASGPLTTVIY
jgi:hypothetical protein